MDESVLRVFGASVALLSGYLFLRFSPYRRFKAEHLRTDRFAFHVLGYPLIAYLVSVLLTSIIDRKFPSTLAYFWLHKAADYYVHTEPAILLTLLVGPVLGCLDSGYIMLRMRRDPFVKDQGWWRIVAKSRAAATARFIFDCDDEAIRLVHRATLYPRGSTGSPC